MPVLFRPGPYVCAEWDFGGLPARLMATEGLEIRSLNDLFLAETEIYFKELVPIIKKHQKTKDNPKGCIIMLQIENEYGFFGADIRYINALRDMWDRLGIDLEQYYVDWISNIRKSHWDGANVGINNLNYQG